MAPQSNLECFLSRTTPIVRSNSLPEMIASLNCQQSKYFILGDLWDSYEEWSAYGLGSPILLNRGEAFLQYYTPSLSAMEVYTSNSFMSRCMAEEYDVESYTTFSSSEIEDRVLSRTSSEFSDKTLELDEWGDDFVGHWPTKDRLGQLYFQYVENEKPYWREPFFMKINELAKNYPRLKTFKSVDLSPASWISVAWYPIYCIPSQRNPKQVFAAFLTYHKLSSLSQENPSVVMSQDGFANGVEGKVRDEDNNYISLPPFGLATYKMCPTKWGNLETANQQRIASLLSTANSWSTQPHLRHQDFEHFRTFSRW